MDDATDDPPGGLRAALARGGDAARTIAATDWARTALGPMSSWSPELCTAVALVLRCPFPAHLSWGAELLQFHNDAYRPVLGSTKYPAIGRRMSDTFAEEWDEAIAPRLRIPLEHGEPSWSTGERVVLHRHGFAEESHWAFACLPVYDASGDVAGVLVIALETTAEAVERRRVDALARLDEALASGAIADDDELARIAAQHLGSAIDTPLAALVEPDPVGLRVVACAGAIDPPDRLPLDRGSLDALILQADRTMVPLSELGLTPAPRGDWPAPATHAVVLDVADRHLVLGRHPGLWFDEDYDRHCRRVAAKVTSAFDRLERDRGERSHRTARLQLDRARDALLSDVSHELRTPLALIAGTTHELRSRTDLSDTERATLWRLAERNIDRLRRLVESLLAYGRLEGGHLVPRLVPVDLAHLTAEACESFVGEFRRAGIHFDVEVGRSTATAMVDPDLWEAVVLNLLSNAYKYTLEGRVAVRLDVADDDHVRFSVADTGVGIAAEHLDALFERFHRIRGQPGRTDEGAGIGLALVAGIVHGHGGSIEVDSTPGVGTTMTVTVPVGEPPRAEREAEPASSVTAVPAAATAPPGASDPRRCVLVVDDSDDLLSLMRLVLERRWTVHTARNGHEALQALDQIEPDIVITDVQMPILDGLDLIRAVRERPDTAALPIVLLSGRTAPDQWVGELVDAVISKPFEIDDLVALTGELLGH